MFGASLLQTASLSNAVYLLDLNEDACSSQNVCSHSCCDLGVWGVEANTKVGGGENET